MAAQLQESAAISVRDELIRQPDFILEAMHELGDDFASALNAGNSEAVMRCCRVALAAYADAQKVSHQKFSFARDVSDEAAYNYLLRVYSSERAA